MYQWHHSFKIEFFVGREGESGRAIEREKGNVQDNGKEGKGRNFVMGSQGFRAGATREHHHATLKNVAKIWFLFCMVLPYSVVVKHSTGLPHSCVVICLLLCVF